MLNLLAVVVLAGLMVLWWRMQPAVRVDPARWLLASALRWLPLHRADWGRAMLAELDRIAGRRERWRFALGCARVAMLAAVGASRVWPAVALAIVAGAATVGVSIYAASPRLLVFAAVFAAELAASGWLAWLRARGGADPAPATAGRTMRGAVLAGVAACAGLVVCVAVRHPAAVDRLSQPYPVLLATALTGCLWLALAPPTSAAGSHRAWRFGLAGAGILAGLWLLGLADAVLFGHQLFSGYVLAATLLTFLGLGAGAGRASGRADAGTAIGLWSGLAGALSLFVTGTAASYVTAADAPAARAVQVVSDNLAYLTIMLLALPAIGMTLSAFGSMLGARR